METASKSREPEITLPDSKEVGPQGCHCVSEQGKAATSERLKTGQSRSGFPAS